MYKGKQGEQDLFRPAVQATRRAFRSKYGRKPRPEDFLFPGREGKAITKATIWNWLQGIGKEAQETGIVTRPFEWAAHAFRRTAVTFFYQRTKDVKATQRFARHSNANTTMGAYVDSSIPAAPIFEEALGVA